MAERVTQDEMTDGEVVRSREHPRCDRHRLPHVLVVCERRSEMVHERDALEPCGFRGERTLDDRLVGHSHLGQEQMEGGGHDCAC